MDTQKLEHIRHTLAHLLAQAVVEHYPNAQLTLGPAIDNGFYYDIDFGAEKISDENLKAFQTSMRKNLKKWTEFTHREVSANEAKEIFAGNEYKIELINEIAERGAASEASGEPREKITLYSCGGFEDLCRGGHVENPATEITSDSFKLDRVAGAYWRGDEKNKMLTRIYGLAFESKEKLDGYINQREEAKKRDHKKLGPLLGLFTFSDLVGPGLPMFLPKGGTLVRELEEFVREEKIKRGYSFVRIPHIAKTALYEKSGHLGKYDAMMPIMKDKEGMEMVLKAMNCPHHFELYNSEPHSYRELPLRFAETTTVYRNEKSGELAGLLRVKALTQDDTHHFVRHDQIESEIEMILGLMDSIYKVFGFQDFLVQISVRDPKDKEKYFGSDELWKESENILIEGVKKWGKPYIIEEGEAAFYGPKIDIMVKDAIGRMWQLTTVQLDFNQPENFDMSYVGNDGQKHRPAVLHVAILGSVERFLGVLIEHYAGAFPTWLSPVQVVIVPVREEMHGDYAKEIKKLLDKKNIRVTLSDSNDSLGKRINSAKAHKVPYVIVVGDKEKDGGIITVEGRTEKLEGVTIKSFVERLENEILNRMLN